LGKTLGMGIIGAGTFAQEAHLPAIKRLKTHFKVVAICDRQLSEAVKMAGVFDYPIKVVDQISALLDMTNIDVVDIVLPAHVMPDVVKMAFAAGKHVISEKPISLTVADGKKLLRLHEKSHDLVWEVAENWRQETAIQEAARIVREGLIGKICFFQWNISYPIRPGHKYFNTTWRRNDSFPGGYIFDGGVHHMASLRMILGPIVEVSAMSTSICNDLGKMDSANVVMRVGDQAIGNYFVTYAVDCPWDSKLHIEGENGSLTVDRTEMQLFMKGSEPKTVKFDLNNAFEREFEELYDCVTDGKAIINHPRKSLQDVAVMEAILRSIQFGKNISVEQL
jgi:predicted dehydrogenase